MVQYRAAVDSTSTHQGSDAVGDVFFPENTWVVGESRRTSVRVTVCQYSEQPLIAARCCLLFLPSSDIVYSGALSE